MIAVIFEAWPAEGRQDAYLDIAAALKPRLEGIDGFVDLLVLIIHRISMRAERKVIKELVQDLERVDGKTTLLYKLGFQEQLRNNVTCYITY